MRTVIDRTGTQTRRRNRVTAFLLLAVIVTSAVSGVLYLRHYGFAPQKAESRYH